MRKISGQTLFLFVVVAASCLVLGYLAVTGNNGWAGNPGKRRPAAGRDSLRRRGGVRVSEATLCAERFSGSPGMARQQKLLVEHFEKLGGKVSMQEFLRRHPTGDGVEMANLIVEWHPEQTQRVLFCAHYDTRPYPDRDPRNLRGRFIGANDGASGVAVLMELGKQMAKFKGPVGVDFVLFDGEELVYRDGDRYFFGAERFATTYAQSPPKHRYRWGVLLDMVADKDLQLFQEGHSVGWTDTRPLVEEIWGLRRILGCASSCPA